jgi:putative FmdB family regulatory protein
MPIYEYDCEACGRHFEIRASMTARRGPLQCVHCGSDRVRRDYAGIAVPRPRGGTRGPATGELRIANPRSLTQDVANRYANLTGDGVMREVAERADRGAEPDQLHDFVREVKAERESGKGKRKVQR